MHAQTTETSSQRPVVIVMGSGRSGTSACAGLLAACGVAMEDTLDRVSPFNPTGFVEDAHLVALNRTIMERLSGNSQMPVPRDADLSLVRPEIDAIRDHLAERTTQTRGVWGAKDPRISVLWRIYRDILRDLGLTPRPILCLRDPAVAGRSIGDAVGLGEADAMLLWLTRNLDALREADGAVFILHYEALLADPAGMAEAMARYVFGPDHPPLPDQAALARLVRQDLNRSAAAPVAVANPQVRRFYDLLRPLSGADFDRAALMDNLSEIIALDDAYRPWADIASRAMSGRDRPAQMRQTIDDQATRIDKLLARLEEKDAAITALQNRLAKQRG